VLGEPEPAPFDEFAFGLLPIEAEEPRHPAIGHGRGVEVIEHARMGEGREPLDGENAQMLVAKHRRDAADERGVAQTAIEERLRRRARAPASRRGET
jgi:hypothetical protein